ncbi:MAG: hypothetical protein ACOCVT_00980 [bacterium]
MHYSETLNAILDAYEAWWTDTNSEPVVYYQYPVKTLDRDALPVQWMRECREPSWAGAPMIFDRVLRTGDYSYLDELLDFLEIFTEHLGFLGQGFPRFYPNLGPGIIAALISGKSQYQDGTVWFDLEELGDPMSLESLQGPDDFAGKEYREVVEEFLRRSTERLAGQIPISMTDLGGNLDLLAPLRGSSNCLMDLSMDPEGVLAALEALDAYWLKIYEAFDGIIAPARGELYGAWMQIASRKPWYPLQCDMAAMISPGMFRDFIQPSLQRLARGLGRAVFHLDGPNMIHHLEHVCAVDEIRAIQWTPGAGNPDVQDPAWFDLYSKIIDRGKKVVLLGFPADVDSVRTLFKVLPAREFLLHIEGPDAQRGQQVISIGKEKK